MISEAPPENQEDYFYAAGELFYLKTTLQAFNDAGISVSSMQDILDLGFYLTTAVKCSKTQRLFNFFWFFSNFKRTIEFHPNLLNPLPHFGKVYPLTFKVFISTCDFARIIR